MLKSLEGSPQNQFDGRIQNKSVVESAEFVPLHIRTKLIGNQDGN